METQEILQGIHDWTNGKIVYDISVVHPDGQGNPTPYADLAAALGTGGANIPEGLRKGGMSVKFVRSSDNKYVQYRLMSDTFNTTEDNWQGVSEVPNAFNKDVVEGAYIADRLIYLQNMLAEYVDLELESITGAYLNNNKKVTNGSSWTCKYTYVNAGTIISFKTSSGGSFGGVGIFKQQPIINSYADYIIIEPSGYFIAPYNCYVLVSTSTSLIDTLYIKNAIDYSGKIINDIKDINDNINEVKEYLKDINTNISEYTADGVTKINGYINTSGVHVGYNSTDWKTKYVYVKKGTPIYSNGHVSESYRAGYCNNEPIRGFTLDNIIPTDTTFPYIATQDGYFCISAEITIQLTLETKTKNIDSNVLLENIDELNKNIENVAVDTYSISDDANSLTPIAVYPGVYINNKGNWRTKEHQITKVYQITPSNIYYLDIKGINTAYSLVGWSETEPIQGNRIDNIVPYTSSANRYQVAPNEMNYMIITGATGVTDDYSKVNAYLAVKINTILPNLIFNGFDNSQRYTNSKKIILYIGDSISNMSNWKDVLKNKYGLDYENNKSEMPASVGGTVLVPKQNEVEQHESIWWRCAEHRLLNAGYSPGIISIFGGTNDMTSSSMNIGTPQDIPFVDNSEDFSVETFDASQEWPQTISFCSALKGCILMIKRDYPNAIIVVPTVLYCGGTYGNWTPTGQSLIASEVISKMQVAVAQSMNVIFIPWYWSERRASTIDIFATDNVHPSKAGANVMARWFANYLPL